MSNQDHLIAKVLSGEGSDEEKQTLKKWMEESPENSLYFSRFEQIWQSAKVKSELFEPDTKAALQKLNSLISDKERKEKKEYVLHHNFIKIAAAILLIAISIGVGIYQIGDSKSEDRNLITIEADSEPGDPVVLGDGTKIWLNSNSSLRCPEQFTGNRRVVFLVGEAFFEVKENPEKPFLIHAGNSVTQVLGTSFNINAFSGNEEIIVSVTSGKVAFYSQEEEGRKITLKNGEHGIFSNKAGIPEKIEIHDLNFLSWKTGVLTFDNTTLPVAIETISHHFNKEIILDERLSTCRLSATFNNENIQDILDELTIILHLKISHQDNKIILQGEGC